MDAVPSEISLYPKAERPKSSDFGIDESFHRSDALTPDSKRGSEGSNLWVQRGSVINCRFTTSMSLRVSEKCSPDSSYI